MDLPALIERIKPLTESGGDIKVSQDDFKALLQYVPTTEVHYESMHGWQIHWGGRLSHIIIWPEPKMYEASI